MKLPYFSNQGSGIRDLKKEFIKFKIFQPDHRSQITDRKGFTLIELLIVMAIIAILISIGLASFNRAQQSARDSERKANIETIRGALEQYYSDENVYPPDLNTLEGPAPALVYLRAVPEPPVGTGETSYCYEPTSSDQNYNIGINLETDAGAVNGTCGGNPLDYVLTAQD